MPAVSTPYSERLWVPWTWWLLGAGFVLAVWWAFFVATPATAVWCATIVAAALVGAALLRFGAARIEAGPTELLAGRARIPITEVGRVESLEGEELRLALGVQADARAYVLYRAYCRKAVKLEVLDQEDPTPYWLISTRHPDQLSTRLRAAGVPD